MKCILLAPCLLLLALQLPTVPASCPGCPEETEVNQEIVDFALQELEGGVGGLCKKNVVKVENFNSQVNM